MTKPAWIMFMIASFILMLLMGSVYSYGAIRLSVESQFDISVKLSGYPYMISLFFYAFSMMVTGRYLRIEHTKRVALMGSMMLALGYLISYIAPSFELFILGYGVILGIGVGMLYGIPIKIIALVAKTSSGFYTGIVLLAFGISPLFTAPLIKAIESTMGFSSIWLIFAIMWLLLGFPLTKALHVQGATEKKETVYIVHKKTFIALYVLFFIATSIGLTIIGLSSKIGASYYAFPEPSVNQLLMLFALSNGISRPIMGKIIDKYDIKVAISLSAMLVFLASLISLYNQGQSLFLYGISYSIYWFNLGAWLTLIPVSLRRLEGNQGYSKRYGILFTAYGFGALVGTQLSGVLLHFQESTVLIYQSILVLVTIQYALFHVIKQKLTS